MLTSRGLNLCFVLTLTVERWHLYNITYGWTYSERAIRVLFICVVYRYWQQSSWSKRELIREHFHAMIFYNFRRGFNQYTVPTNITVRPIMVAHRSVRISWELSKIGYYARKYTARELTLEERHVTYHTSKESSCKEMLKHFNRGASKIVYKVVTGDASEV